MTPNEVDILLQAINAVRDDVHELDKKFETFRTYADITFIRKDTLQSAAETKEMLWKKRDRVLSRIAVIISALSVVAVVIIGTLHH